MPSANPQARRFVFNLGKLKNQFKHKLTCGDRPAMSLEEYLIDIVRVPMLTCDEEIILGTQIQEMMQALRDNGLEEQVSQENLKESIKTLQPGVRQIVKKGLKARNRMISANMRLVVAVAKKIKTAQIHLTIQDMIQEGAIGLARAAEKFEPGRGYKFSTYAYWWIRQGIVRAGETQEKIIKIPSNVQKTAKQIREAKEKLSNQLSKNPTIAEIAEEIGEDPEKVKKTILLDVAVISLDSKVSHGEDQISLIELIPAGGQEDSSNVKVNSDRLDFLLMLISALTPDEQKLIKQKYGIGCEVVSTKEIAEASGVSEQVVRQRQQKITSKIRYVAGTFSASERP